MTMVPGVVAPMPTSDDGLSPVERTTWQSARMPNFSTKYVRHEAGEGGAGGGGRELGAEVGRGGIEQGVVPVERLQVEQVHAGAVAVVDGDRLAGHHRADEGADEVDDGGPFIGGGVRLEEAADLRAGEALDGDRAGLAADLGIAADRRGDLGALGTGGGVHPDRRGRAGEGAGKLAFEGFGGFQRGEAGFEGGVQVERAVLLAGAGDGVIWERSEPSASGRRTGRSLPATSAGRRGPRRPCRRG